MKKSKACNIKTTFNFYFKCLKKYLFGTKQKVTTTVQQMTSPRRKSSTFCSGSRDINIGLNGDFIKQNLRQRG